MRYLILIDGNNMIIRRYFIDGALPRRTLVDLVDYLKDNLSYYIPNLDKEDSVKIIIILDDKQGKAVRQSIYPNYKDREVSPIQSQSFFDELNELKQTKKIENSYIMVSKEMEADDVIANFCRELKGIRKLIFSNDKDFFGLIDGRTAVVRDFPKFSKQKDIMNRKRFVEEFGDNIFQNEINLFYVYKALIGDKSDNIQGVKGVGDKTAKKIIEEIGLANSLNEASEKVVEMLKENKKYSDKDIDDFKLALRLVYPIYKDNFLNKKG